MKFLMQYRSSKLLKISLKHTTLNDIRVTLPFIIGRLMHQSLIEMNE